jgi:hypothetical protein
MALPLMTEQKTRIVEWFLQTNSIVTVQRRFKTQYNEAPARNTVKTLVEQFRATGNVTDKKRGGCKPRDLFDSFIIIPKNTYTRGIQEI